MAVVPALVASVLAAMQADTLLPGLLGTGDAALSLYPSLTDATALPPPAASLARPWGVVEELPLANRDDVVGLGGVRVKWYDDPDNGPWRLAGLVGWSLKFFATGPRRYADSGAPAFYQRVANVSAVLPDDAWQQVFRYVDVQLGRWMS